MMSLFVHLLGHHTWINLYNIIHCHCFSMVCFKIVSFVYCLKLILLSVKVSCSSVASVGENMKYFNDMAHGEFTCLTQQLPSWANMNFSVSLDYYFYALILIPIPSPVPCRDISMALLLNVYKWGLWCSEE